jgi:hypothetical protein
MCDGCTRVVCSQHIPLPRGTTLGVAIFLCVACHIRIFSKPVPYFVSFIVYLLRGFSDNNSDSFCFQGFYKGDTTVLGNPSDSWKATFPEPLLIGGNYQLTSNSQVIADPLLVLHFILVSISPKGNPARIISEMLGGFLQDESFAYEEVIFDLASNELTLEYTNAISVLVQSLEG